MTEQQNTENNTSMVDAAGNTADNAAGIASGQNSIGHDAIGQDDTAAGTPTGATAGTAADAEAAKDNAGEDAAANAATVLSFEELGVRPDLLRGIKELGFERPMPIQQQVIPYLLDSDRDVVGLAQTGTGKTAAFGLPLIQRVDTKLRRPQALILAPTRELCLQIASDLADYAKYIPAIEILPVYGGSSIRSQIKALRAGGIQIIVATPGRLLDLIDRGVVHLDDVHTVVLDEADEMLNMGFIDSINDILAHVPEDRKMLLFSATMPAEVAKIARRFMHDPVEIVVGHRNQGAENVRHIYYMVAAKDKYLALKRIADDSPNIYAIVFCRTRSETQEIADRLISDGYNADSLHGDLSQQQRDIVMKKFREGHISILVATDVAARGLDVDDLTHVINFGLPDDTAVYTHRSGRTGRAGKTGISVAIIHTREQGRLRQVERSIGKKFERSTVPTPQHIIEKQLYNLADRLEKVKVDDGEIEKYLPGITKKLSWLSGEDLLKRVLSLEFNRLLAYYKDVRDIDVADTKEGRRRDDKGDKGGKGGKDRPKRERAFADNGERPTSDADKDRRTADEGLARIYVNAGKAQGFFAGNLITMINRGTRDTRIDVGRIDLLTDYTLFDVGASDAAAVISALRGADFFGQVLYSEIAEPGKDYAGASKRKTARKTDGERGRKAGRRSDFKDKGEKPGGRKGKPSKSKPDINDDMYFAPKKKHNHKRR